MLHNVCFLYDTLTSYMRNKILKLLKSETFSRKYVLFIYGNGNGISK